MQSFAALTRFVSLSAFCALTHALIVGYTLPVPIWSRWATQKAPGACGFASATAAVAPTTVATIAITTIENILIALPPSETCHRTTKPHQARSRRNHPVG